MAVDPTDPNYDPNADYNAIYQGMNGGPPGPPASAPGVDPKAIDDLYQSLLGRAAAPADLQAMAQNPGGLDGIKQAILASSEYKGKQPQPTTTPTPQPNTTGGTNFTPPPNGANITAPFTEPAPTPTTGQVGVAGSPTPGTPYIPPTPQFNAPTYTPPPAFSYADFKAPTVADAVNDPGYQFRLQQGQKALDMSAASKGVLNTGNSIQSAVDYGQNAASQEYQNVYNRDFNTWQANGISQLGQYNTNYQTQYQDPFKIAYQSAQDAFAPQMTAYSTQAAAGQHQSDINYGNAYNTWLQDWNIFKDQRDSTWNKNFSYAQA